MAGGKETPRQKMIGMMYLVLTALLAMNVSKDILNAFVVINAGLVKTNGNFDIKNNVTSTAFQLAMLNNERKTAPYNAAAMSIRTKSKQLDVFIDDLKKKLIGAVEGEGKDTTRLEYVGSKDNYDIPTHLMVGGDPEHNPQGFAVDLKKLIIDYRTNITDIIQNVKSAEGKKIEASKVESFIKGMALKTDKAWSTFEEEEVSWENNLFYHVPLAAQISHLSRLQNEVKNAEGDAINMLYNEISAADFKFDKVEAKVIPNSNYILAGNEYSADIFLAAYSTTQNPVIQLGEIDTVTGAIKGAVDSASVKVANGLGVYSVKTGSEGLQKYSGLIKIKAPDNSIKSYRFSSEYMVARPAAAVSPEKMNVFYIGVDNPVAISAAGVAPTDLTPSMSGGSLVRAGAPGKYTVRVTTGTEATINVGAKVNGNNQNMGSFKFRVKRVPDPVAFFAGKKGDDKISKAELMGAAGVIAKLENFDFDLTFNVTGFEISAMVGGLLQSGASEGNRLSSQQIGILKNVKSGGKVYIEAVRAKGPDGTLRKIPGVNLKIQ